VGCAGDATLEKRAARRAGLAAKTVLEQDCDLGRRYAVGPQERSEPVRRQLAAV
jgi:hypothetical protein